MGEFDAEAQKLEAAALKFVHLDGDQPAVGRNGDQIFDEVAKFLKEHPGGAEQLQRSINDLRTADPHLPVIEISASGNLMIQRANGDKAEPHHVMLRSGAN